MFDYDDFISRIDTALVGARFWNYTAENYYTAAKYEYDTGNDHAAMFEMLGMLFSLQKSVDYLAPYRNLLYGLWNLERLGDGIKDDFINLCNGAEYELTLTKMLGAYIAAPEIDRRSHRYLLDAFKASMYNKPFDLSYHTEWVRRFESWE